MEVTQHNHGNLYSSMGPAPMHSVSPMARQSTPVYPPPLDGKIHEINQRLRDRPEFTNMWWWDSFASEFFDDTATMLISFSTTGDVEKHYTIGRAMIPQYFSSIFDGGATEMHLTFSYPRQYMSHTGPTLECDNVLTTTQYLQPSFARVLVESRVSLQCTFDERARISSWTQYLLRQKEYVPREMISLSLQEGRSIDSLLTNFTHLGLNNCTLNFLNVSAISDTMRPDIKPNLNYPVQPPDCIPVSWPVPTSDSPISTCMINHSLANPPLNQTMADFSQSPVLSTNTDSANSSERFSITKSPKPTKKPKRVRKGAASKATAASPVKKIVRSCSVSSITSPSTQPTMTQPVPQQQDVMVVGEPMMMGGDLGDKDERRITRLENNNSTDFLPSDHNLHIPPQTGLNGSAVHPNCVSNDGGYDEPSITAALDALEQEAAPMHIPLT